MEPSILTKFWGPLSKLKRFICALSDLGLTSNKTVLVAAFREDEVLSCGQVVTLWRIRKSHMWPYCCEASRWFTAGLISTKRV